MEFLAAYTSNVWFWLAITIGIPWVIFLSGLAGLLVLHVHHTWVATRRNSAPSIE